MGDGNIPCGKRHLCPWSSRAGRTIAAQGCSRGSSRRRFRLCRGSIRDAPRLPAPSGGSRIGRYSCTLRSRRGRYVDARERSRGRGPSRNVMSVYVFHVVHVYLSYLVSSEEMQELGVAVEVRIMHQMDLVTLDVVVSVRLAVSDGSPVALLRFFRAFFR
jgi:hypothetical protein